MRPSASVMRSPQAACSYSASAEGSEWSVLCIVLPASCREKAAHGRKARTRRTQVRTMADVIDNVQRAGRHHAMHVIAHRARRDDVVATLQNERGRFAAWKQCAVVG